MRKAIPAILALLAIPTLVFAATIAPTTATWNAETGGDLAFTVTGATGIISYEEAVKVGTAPLYFTYSGGKGSFGKEDYKYASPTLTIYETALKKMPNNTFNVVATTTDTETKVVTVADADVVIDLTADNIAGVGAVVFKKDDKTITLDPSEFSFASGVLTVPKGTVASGDYTATIYEGLPFTLTVSGNDETTGTDEDASSNSSNSIATSNSNSSSSGSNSGGGCNAGFGALALIALMPLAFKRK